MLEQVAPRVWVRTSAVWQTTTTVVVADDGACLLVDPALLPREISDLVQEIAERGWRVTAGFSTHPHWDHVLWSAALPAVPRWATPTAARWASENAAVLAGQAQADLPGYRCEIVGGTSALPTEDAELPWDGPRAVVVPSPGHALGHACLYLPDDGVLLAGDMLSDVEVPLLDTGLPDPITEYRRGLDAVADVLEGSDVVVPGHGSWADADEARRRLAADRRYLDDLPHSTDPRLVERRMWAEHDLQVQELGPRIPAAGSRSAL